MRHALTVRRGLHERNRCDPRDPMRKSTGLDMVQCGVRRTRDPGFSNAADVTAASWSGGSLPTQAIGRSRDGQDRLLQQTARSLQPRPWNSASRLAAEDEAGADPRSRRAYAGHRCRRQGSASAVPSPHEASLEDHALLERGGRCGGATASLPTTVLLAGDTVDEIVAYADSHDVDLIVIGSRGHGAIVNALLGSVSRGVLAESSGPSSVVRGGAPVPHSGNRRRRAGIEAGVLTSRACD